MGRYYLYSSNSVDYNEPNDKILKQKLRVECFRPRFFRLFHKCEKANIKTGAVRLYFFVITGGRFRIYYLMDGSTIAHTSYVVPYCIKFPFMEKDDYEIGPCATEPAYRRLGCYHYMLRYICSEHNKENIRFYMLVNPPNVASIHGVEKAGFQKCGVAEKNKLLNYHKVEGF